MRHPNGREDNDAELSELRLDERIGSLIRELELPPSVLDARVRRRITGSRAPGPAVGAAATVLALIIVALTARALPGLVEPGGAPASPGASDGRGHYGPAASVSYAANTVGPDGRLLVAGGATDGPSDTVTWYDMATGVASPGPPLPEPRVGAAAVNAGGRVLVVGGWNSFRYLDTIIELDPDDGGWTEIARLPSARAYLAAGWIGNQLVLLGGVGPGAVDPSEVFWLFDLEAGTWVERTSTHAARAYAAATVVDGRLIVFGGKATDVESYLASVVMFDPVRDSWTALPPLPEGLNSMAAASTSHGPVVIGGFSQKGATARALLLELGEVGWRELPALGIARAGLSLGSTGDRILAVGGCCTDDPSRGLEWIVLPATLDSSPAAP